MTVEQRQRDLPNLAAESVSKVFIALVLLAWAALVMWRFGVLS